MTSRKFSEFHIEKLSLISTVYSIDNPYLQRALIWYKNLSRTLFEITVENHFYASCTIKYRSTVFVEVKTLSNLFHSFDFFVQLLIQAVIDYYE